jgi:hypothetical protein
MAENGRGLIQGTFPAFVWKDGGKPRKPSVRIASLRVEICTVDLLNTQQEC